MIFTSICAFHIIVSYLNGGFSKRPSFKLDPEVEDQNNHGAFK